MKTYCIVQVSAREDISSVGTGQAHKKALWHIDMHIRLQKLFPRFMCTIKITNTSYLSYFDAKMETSVGSPIIPT